MLAQITGIIDQIRSVFVFVMAKGDHIQHHISVSLALRDYGNTLCARRLSLLAVWVLAGQVVDLFADIIADIGDGINLKLIIMRRLTIAMALSIILAPVFR
jgi:hypothetical protein